MPLAPTLRRELLLGVRTPAEIINPLFFFVVVVSLFPLALSPAPDTPAPDRSRCGLGSGAAGGDAVAGQSVPP